MSQTQTFRICKLKQARQKHKFINFRLHLNKKKKMLRNGNKSMKILNPTRNKFKISSNNKFKKLIITKIKDKTQTDNNKILKI